MKGLSGAVTALILVIASVIIALIVVGFAFGLFGTLSGQNAITNAGSAYVEYNPSNNHIQIYVTLTNPGPATPVISSVSVNSIPVSLSEVVNNGQLYTTSLNSVTISTGQNSLTISGSLISSLNVQSGATVTVQVSLSNGQVVTVPAVVSIVNNI